MPIVRLEVKKQSHFKRVRTVRQYSERMTLEIRPQKRIFIGLLVFTCVILFFLIFLLWYVPIVGLKNIHPSLPLIFSLSIAFLVFLMISGGLLLVFTILRGKDIFLSHKLRGLVAKVLFPLMILMGKVVGIPKEKVRQSFIELNNHLIRSNRHRVPPEKLLILLPHCIQNFDCEVKITGNIRNCRSCGKCEIKDLIELSDQYHLKIAVATGGTLARRIVLENRPEAIVAVACELDLTSGIQETYPIPVIGILNERPNGPCINTKVDLEKVRNAILYFLNIPNLQVGNGSIFARTAIGEEIASDGYK
ncbi:MAG: hypothetical protein H6Q41_928 [Deltaproteobacteria bacterium]|jgi:hypothetical protein|nr:hypothetical protein [Deltaproteobacteria bacterium]